MIRPEEVPAVIMQMALAGEAPEQIEALEWTSANCPEFLQWMQWCPSHKARWKIWPAVPDWQGTAADSRHKDWEGFVVHDRWLELMYKRPGGFFK